MTIITNIAESIQKMSLMWFLLCVLLGLAALIAIIVYYFADRLGGGKNERTYENSPTQCWIYWLLVATYGLFILIYAGKTIVLSLLFLATASCTLLFWKGICQRIVSTSENIAYDLKSLLLKIGDMAGNFKSSLSRKIVGARKSAQGATLTLTYITDNFKSSLSRRSFTSTKAILGSIIVAAFTMAALTQTFDYGPKTFSAQQANAQTSGSAPVARPEPVNTTQIKAVQSKPKPANAARVAKKPVTVKPVKAKQLSQKKAVQSKRAKAVPVVKKSAQTKAKPAKKPTQVKRVAQMKAAPKAHNAMKFQREIFIAENKRQNFSCPAAQAQRNLVNLVGYVAKQGDNGISPETLNGRRSLFTPTMNGVYKDGPLHTAINRLHNYAAKHGTSVPKWADHALYTNNPEAFYNVSLQDQQALVLIDLAEQVGTDQRLQDAACGQATNNASVSLYVENIRIVNPTVDSISWTQLAAN